MAKAGKWVLLILLLLGGALVAVSTPDLPVEELKRAYATGSSRFIELDGLSVHYRDEGQGPPLVLLHGTGASLHTWDAWSSALASHHRVIRMDLPGFGLTGPDPKSDYSIPAFVSFVDSFCKKLGLTRFALAGNSLGGQIAWNLAVAHPEQVTDLILLDPAGYPIARPALIFRLARIPVLSSLLTHADPGAMVKKTLRDAYGDQSKVTPALIDRYRRLSLRAGNRDAFVARVKQSPVDRTADLPHVAARTLILWGREDRLIPVAHAERFAKAIPGAKLIVYDSVGHLPMEEIGERSAADAEAFLTAAK